MASSAFKSTTKRTPIGASVASNDDSASTNRSSIHRRSRSLSRFSHPLPSSPADKGFDEGSARQGRFVNTSSRGSGFPEISLDDLAVEFFGSGDRGRSAARSSESSGATNAAVASNRRGRSVSRHSCAKGSGGSNEGKGRASYSVGGGKVVPESNSRRRRSLSVVRYQISDSESDIDRSQNSGIRVKEKSYGIGNKQKPISHKADDSNRRPSLQRSLSQNDFKCHDGYSSQSSVLTDDEGKDTYFGNGVMEETIRSIYARKAKQPNGDVVDNGGLYEAMRKELRHAVEEIRVELEQEMVNRNSSVGTFSDDLHSSDSGICQHTSPFTRNYSTKQEQSGKRRDSLGKMVTEEQRGQERPKMIKNLPPDLKNAVAENPSRTRKRSKDRSRMSKRLSEEAEKYIEDFISNVEDTDISSLDGDRSDASSSLRGKEKPNFKIHPQRKRMVSFKVAFFLFVGFMVGASKAQLCPTFYDDSCPDVSDIVRGVVQQALETDDRAGARLIRLHFHDCFVDGCDGSVLLVNQTGVVSELGAPGNANITGFNIVDDIKAALEEACPGVVSCADILALASVHAVSLVGGPFWEVQLGRRDRRRANLQGAIDGLPSPFENVRELKEKFGRVGLDSTDLVALSGAHTFGRSRCRFFDRRLNVSSPDNTLDASYATQLRQACASSRDTFLNLDPTTPDDFDNNYYTNLQSNFGLLGSDQVLFSTPGEDTVDIVNMFAGSEQQFFDSFGQSMINMGNISPLTGDQGEVRCNCRRLN